MTLGPPTKRYLVITRAGRNSLHPAWLLPASERSFDLLVASFEELPHSEIRDGLFRVSVPGTKVHGWKTLVEKFSGFIYSYDYIALIDDDIETDAQKLSKLFKAGEAYGLSIWQPSLSWDSYLTYAGTAHNPYFKVRYVNYIEMMAPFFSREALRQVAPLFSYGWESGIDLMWGSAVSPDMRKFAVIDAVQVKHTRPVGLLKEANGFVDRDYESDISQSLRHFQMEWPSLVASSGIKQNGKLTGRFGVAARTFALLSLVRKNPSSDVLRRVTDHIRHQLTRNPAYSDMVSQIMRDDKREGRI